MHINLKGFVLAVVGVLALATAGCSTSGDASPFSPGGGGGVVPTPTPSPSPAPILPASCPGLGFNGTQYTATLVFHAAGQACGGVGGFFIPGPNGTNLPGTVTQTIADPTIVSITPSLNGTLMSPGNPGTAFIYTALKGGTTTISLVIVTSNPDGTTSTYNGTITIQNMF
ncbi:MAG: hypothetical protein M3126_00025 [Candidatus Eremiobacteraeota bacterium]|nr:hypothetical protein [Candidatus Eremiobacteraeota bacterium]